MIRIITPLSRPQNLPQIYQSLKKHLDAKEVIWHIVMDASLQELPLVKGEGVLCIKSPHYKAKAGHAHRNFALQHFRFIDAEDWIYFLDDDNILHHGLVDMLQAIHGNVVVFDQLVRRRLVPFLVRRRKADRDKIRICQVDTAMFAFRFKSLKGVKWREDLYEADGLFIEELSERNSVVIVNQILSYYNWIPS